jgi:hypothetical protein
MPSHGAPRQRAADSGAYAVVLRRLMFLVPLKPHMREAGLAETERTGGGERNVNDPAANEGSPIDNFQDRGAAIVQVDNLHSRSHRERFVGRNQPAEMWILIV